MASRATDPSTTRTLRADARRNVERILDGAVEQLSEDPDSSMAAIAKRAGVVRATVYVHFPNRDALIDALAERAIAEAADAMRRTDPDAGEASAALERVLAAAWRTIGRHHFLVLISTGDGRARDHDFHAPALSVIRSLLDRGRDSGAFNRDLPMSWMLAVVLELIHAASREVSSGRLDDETAERALQTSVLGALAPVP